MKVVSFKTKILALVGASLTLAMAATGCGPGDPPKLIQAIEVCGHVYDGTGDLSDFQANFRASGHNNHLGVDWGGSSGWITLDNTGRACVRFELGAASDYDTYWASLTNLTLTVSANGSAAPAQPYGNPDELYDSAPGFGYYFLRIYADFDMRVALSKGPEFLNAYIQTQAVKAGFTMIQGKQMPYVPQVSDTSGTKAAPSTPSGGSAPQQNLGTKSAQ